MSDRVLPGIALMLGFCATAPLIDVFSKLAAQTVSVGEVTAARFVVQGLLMLPFALMAGARPWPPRDALGALALRAACLVLSTFAFVSAIDRMPIADALAIVFVMPFALLILGHLAMGDAVGPRRVAACAVGFAGSLLVIRPSFAEFGWVALWPLVTAVSFAVYMLATRALGPRFRVAEMQVHTSLLATAMSAPLLLVAGPLGWEAATPVGPGGVAWLWLLGVGAASAVAHGMMTVALRLAPSATLAPLEYLEIVTAAVLGWLVFGDWPDLVTWAGIAVIVASGLYVIHRERVTASAARAGARRPPSGEPRGAG